MRIHKTAAHTRRVRGRTPCGKIGVRTQKTRAGRRARTQGKRARESTRARSKNARGKARAHATTRARKARAYAAKYARGKPRAPAEKRARESTRARTKGRPYGNTRTHEKSTKRLWLGRKEHPWRKRAVPTHARSRQEFGREGSAGTRMADTVEAIRTEKGAPTINIKLRAQRLHRPLLTLLVRFKTVLSLNDDVPVERVSRSVESSAFHARGLRRIVRLHRCCGVGA